MITTDKCPNCGSLPAPGIDATSTDFYCVACTWEPGEEHFMPHFWGKRGKNVSESEKRADWGYGRTHNWATPGDIKKKKPLKSRRKRIK